MNAYDLVQYARENPKLVKLKESTSFPGLYVVKYTKTAFFGGKWDRFLEDSRGAVIAINRYAGLGGDIEEVSLVALPFRKIYNYGIDKESPVFPPDTVVEAHRKVNGFMLAITPLPNGKFLFSTTGSLDSEFVDMGRGVFNRTIREPVFRRAATPGYTYLFECVHPSDPHIIPELDGLYFIGSRRLDFDAPVIRDQVQHDQFVAAGCYPVERENIALSDLIAKVKTVQHEGFVFYTPDGQSAKLKSPYYLAAKMFARAGNLDRLLNGKAKDYLDEEYYPLIAAVRESRDEFESMPEQARLEWIRRFFGTIYN